MGNGDYNNQKGAPTTQNDEDVNGAKTCQTVTVDRKTTAQEAAQKVDLVPVIKS
jgi:hypothetical protein